MRDLMIVIAGMMISGNPYLTPPEWITFLEKRTERTLTQDEIDILAAGWNFWTHRVPWKEFFNYEDEHKQYVEIHSPHKSPDSFTVELVKDIVKQTSKGGIK